MHGEERVYNQLYGVNANWDFDFLLYIHELRIDMARITTGKRKAEYMKHEMSDPLRFSNVPQSYEIPSSHHFSALRGLSKAWKYSGTTRRRSALSPAATFLSQQSTTSYIPPSLSESQGPLEVWNPFDLTQCTCTRTSIATFTLWQVQCFRPVANVSPTSGSTTGRGGTNRSTRTGYRGCTCGPLGPTTHLYG